jgi:hypothetical protein
VAEHQLEPGVYEALLTGALDKRLADLVVEAVTPELRTLADAEAADRLSRHVAMVVTRAIEAMPEQGRAQAGAHIIARLIDLLSDVSDAIDPDVDLPLDPARVLSSPPKARRDRRRTRNAADAAPRHDAPDELAWGAGCWTRASS